MTHQAFRQAHSFSCLVLALTSIFFDPRLVVAANGETQNPDSLMDNMVGRWVMTGTIDNEKVTHDVHVDRILKGHYLRIHEVAREKDAVGDPAYEAWIHIAWDKVNSEYVVMWLDNTAITNFASDGVGHGKPDGDRITLIWKSADGSGIHNTFAYERKSGKWFWTIDNVDTAGSTSRFARLELKREQG
jgi:hypothetical protein